MNKHDEAVRLLAAGFSEDFAEFCAGHDRMHELMMELAEEFTQENIPIVNEDAHYDVCYELMMNVTIQKV